MSPSMQTPHTGESMTLRGGSRLLRTLAWSLVLVTAAVGVGQTLSELGHPRPGVLVGLTTGIGILMLLQHGQTRSAAITFVVMLTIGAPFAAFTAAGPVSSAWTLLPLAAMLAGWLLGPRIAWNIALLGSALVAMIFAAHGQGAVFVAPLPLLYLVTNSVVTLMGAFIGAATAKSFDVQLARVYALRSELQDANQTLEQRVAARSAELEQATHTLRQAQQDLAESERLASLGTMVAGISHELNTPLGNALGVATGLHSTVQSLRQAVETESLQRAQLDDYLERADGMLALIERSVLRATRLVDSVKQVANDRCSGERRRFDLRETVDTELMVLQPGLKARQLSFENQVPPGLVCDSYPGALGQILLNLVSNAQRHAFAEGAAGHITISAHADGERLRLVVTDNGSGMPPAILARVFDPFFTTRLGLGGPGLGLTLSQRLAAASLGGDLSATSIPGAGSQFTLEFPRRAPDPPPDSDSAS